jgi:small nuclear ribonucleoprotein (snRNP)-like protein
MFHQFFKNVIASSEKKDEEAQACAASLITLHLKNDMKIEGLLLSIDKNMNMHVDISQNRGNLPIFMHNLKTLYIRGNSIKYVTFDKNEIKSDFIQSL